MKKVFFVSLIVLAFLLMIGCPHPNSPSSKKSDESKFVTISEREVGMEYFEVGFRYSGTQKVDHWELYLYENPDDTSSTKSDWAPKYNYSKFTGLLPGHEYTLKADVVFSGYDKCSVTKKISTLPKAAPVITGKFSSKKDYKTIDTKVTVSWNEIGSFTKKVELYRSDSETGDYVLVGTDNYPSNNSSISDASIKENKSYWYKVMVYEKPGEEYVKIGESAAIEVQTGAAVPRALEENDVICRKGITTLSFTWPEVEGVQKYSIILKKGFYSQVTIEEKDVTENTYVFKGLQPDTEYEFGISVTTAGGTSSNTEIAKKTASAKLSYSDKVAVTPEQTQALYTIPVHFEETTDCTVTFTLRKSSSETSDVIMDLGELDNFKFIRTALSPATYYSTSSSGKESGYVHMSVTYKDENGNDKTVTSYLDAGSFCTKNLAPPTNLRIESISKTEVTIGFDEITDEEKLGKIPKYSICAYTNNNQIAKDSSGHSIIESANHSPITLTGLTKGTEYIFKVETTFDGATSLAPREAACITGHTESGIQQKPVVQLSEVKPDSTEPHLQGVYTYIKAVWDSLDATEGVVPENLVYGVEYKIFEHSQYSHPLAEGSTSENPVNRILTGTGRLNDKFLVNGGNTYTVRVYAYDKNEPDDIVYSEPEKISLEKINDRDMYAALTYTQEFADHVGNGAQAGDVVDFTEKKVWEREGSIRSVQGSYNIGYLQLLGKIPSSKYLFPSIDGLKFVSFKFNLEKAIENSSFDTVTSVPRIIFLDRYAFSMQESDYGYFDGVYFIIPNKPGTILNEVKDDFYSNLKMPFFFNNQTSKSPNDVGLEVDEDWIFNNSVYIGVSQVTAGNIGFSYYY